MAGITTPLSANNPESTVPGHPAVVDGDDADGGPAVLCDIEECEDVAGSSVGARELEVAARVGEEDEALGVAQLHGLASEPRQQDGGVLERSQGSGMM